MRAITLWQPWASLIAYGIKTRETRSWRFPVRMLSERIAIHAAKRPYDLEGGFNLPLLLPAEAFDEHGTLPRGAVVATARLAGFMPTTAVTADPYGDYTPGRWAWLLEDIERVDPPVAARGYQGFWTWEGHGDG